MDEKLNYLQNNLKKLKKVAVAFSGGTDSTFLLRVAKDILKDNVIALTINSPYQKNLEIENAKNIAKKIKVTHIIINLKLSDLDKSVKNDRNRCYYCKKVIFSKIKNIAEKRKINYILDASNTDDLKDYRPGRKALEELEVLSPLIDANLNKTDIRNLSKKLKLETWDKPSDSCLASRLPYGHIITAKKLEMIKKAEQIIQSIGIIQTRVRLHEDIARIEVDKKEIPRILKNSKKITNHFKIIGFDYITLDLQGYRTGSLNEVLD